MIKVLQIGIGNIAGGLEAFVMNYYRVLVSMDVQFDFLCMYDKIAYEEEISALGGHVFYVPNVKKDYIGYTKQLKEILKNTTYDAVHVNMLSAANIVPLRIAHQMGVKKVIAHSHNSSCPGLVRKLMNWWNRPRVAKYATDKAACGELAGRWMFGDRSFESGQVTVLHNAIDAEKFCFSEKERTDIRRRYGWDGKFVTGHVGRFDLQKNHERIIDIFSELKKEKPNAVLCLVGQKDGLYEKIEEKVKTAGLENDIFFVGKQKNVNAFLSAMDLFLFPSLFEGVPFALIEAQASGLPCVASDTISEETLVFPEKVKYLSLKEENRVWAGEICKMGELPREKAGQLKEKLANKHFDIALEAVQLKKLYQE